MKADDKITKNNMGDGKYNIILYFFCVLMYVKIKYVYYIKNIF